MEILIIIIMKYQSLNRIDDRAHYLKSLQNACAREQSYLKKDEPSRPFQGNVYFSPESMYANNLSDEIFTRQAYGNTRNMVPIEVAEDGNCLINALSMALIGTVNWWHHYCQASLILCGDNCCT